MISTHLTLAAINEKTSHAPLLQSDNECIYKNIKIPSPFSDIKSESQYY